MAALLTTNCLASTSQVRPIASTLQVSKGCAQRASFYRGGRTLLPGPCTRKTQQCSRAKRLAARALGDEGELLPGVEEGTKVRVTQEILVYHAPKTKELQLKGKEGTVKTIVKHYKGKDTSANLPYRVEFMLEQDSGKQQKWFAHLAASEIEKIE